MNAANEYLQSMLGYPGVGLRSPIAPGTKALTPEQIETARASKPVAKSPEWTWMEPIRIADPGRSLQEYMNAINAAARQMRQICMIERDNIVTQALTSGSVGYPKKALAIKRKT